MGTNELLVRWQISPPVVPGLVASCPRHEALMLISHVAPDLNAGRKSRPFPLRQSLQPNSSAQRIMVY